MPSGAPVHLQVLDAARQCADRTGSFRLRDVVAALPHLNPGTVRTHVASRCSVNAPAHHQTRWPYFRALGRGRYRLEPGATGRRQAARPRGWQDRILEGTETGVDPTLIAESLTWTPTERLERMRQAAVSLDEMRATARRVPGAATA
ncbi:MAG: DUF7669 domain-containing protein [Vicinamibacterales bacterium]